jgi:hypothetical protein
VRHTGVVTSIIVNGRELPLTGVKWVEYDAGFGKKRLRVRPRRRKPKA